MQMSETGSITDGRKVSFIIANWNHRQLLHECISSIYETEASLSLEIIVVDNASSDNSAEHIKKTFPGVVWLQNDTNRGYAEAVNQGVKLSTGDLIFLLNNDITLAENSVKMLYSFLIANQDAGAVAPRLYYPDGRKQISCSRFPTLPALLMEFFGIDKIWHYRRLTLKEEEHLSTGIVQQPMTSALMVKRKCWNSVGPMDEGFPIFFNDVDWCYRLYANTPYRIYLFPEAKAVHHKGASVKRLGYKKWLIFSRGLMRFYRKHFPFRSVW
ncbi:MAG TPA: glycosyltransferase family 2 protein [Thermodesulfovibrionales bacterium]|nr:glycosyltransferase family 2 protein [Thermodesulfovibrionales bacterium]